MIFKKYLVSIFFIFLLGMTTYCVIRARTFQFFGEIYPRINTSHKVVALTFDDGPTAKTDTILSILNKLNIKATFFVNGSDILNHQSETRKIVLARHELGNHTYSHQRMVFKSYNFIKSEVDKTDALIRQMGYRDTIHFRPPFGKKLIFLPYYLSKNQRKTIMWDIEPESFAENTKNAQSISSYTIENSLKGSIILLHVMKDKTNESVKSIHLIVKGLQAKGYSFKTVSELLNAKKTYYLED